MTKIKTHKTTQDVTAFINAVGDEKKRTDSFKLIEIMAGITGEKPYMYGPTIVGFGNYHYKYATGHEGHAPLAGFSPRKSAISLYLAAQFPGKEELLKQLGKCKPAVSCVYVKRLEDINIPILKTMISASAKHTKEIYPE